jgi:hypothetical protein
MYYNRGNPLIYILRTKPRVLVSVRKVVLTLTSKSVEIYLSMAGAKKLGDTGFILVPARAVRPAVVCSGHCIVLHCGACRGELQARRERRRSLQVPEVLIEAECQYRGEGRKRGSECCLSSPPQQGDCPSFYTPRGGSLQACHAVLATCDGMAYSAAEETAVLVNLASRGASWRALYPSRSGFEGGAVEISRLVVVRTLTWGSSWQEAVGRTAAGVEVSCRPVTPQRRGWRCSAWDGVMMAGMAAQDRWWWRRLVSLVWRHNVVLDMRGTGVCPPFEGSAVLFRGCGVSAVREWEAQCHGADTGLAAQCRTVAGWPHRESWRNSAGIWFPSVSEGRQGVDSSLTRAPASVRTLNAPIGGAGAGVASPWEPRARRSLIRGGDGSLSEAEPHPRGRSALERGGTLAEGASSPRARWKLASAALCPSSQAEFRPSVAGPAVLVGRWGHQGRGPRRWAMIVLSVF